MCKFISHTIISCRFCTNCWSRCVGKMCPGCSREKCGEDMSRLPQEPVCPDYACQRELGKLRAKCRLLGCEWTGKLNDYDGHNTKCSAEQIPCPNGCGSFCSRGSVELHIHEIRGDCPNLDCPFGCNTKNTPEHAQEYLHYHMIQTFQEATQLKNAKPVPSVENRRLKAKVDILHKLVCVLHNERIQDAKKIAEMNKEITNLRIQIMPLQPVLAELREQNIQQQDLIEEQSALINELQTAVNNSGEFIFLIKDFTNERTKCEETDDYAVTSSEFFTAPNGYKAEVMVYLNGHHSHNTLRESMTVGFRLKPGPYDVTLKFPFDKTVTICLLGLSKRSRGQPWPFPEGSSDSLRRPRVDQPNPPVIIAKFMRLSELDSQRDAYVKEDTMAFRVNVTR